MEGAMETKAGRRWSVPPQLLEAQFVLVFGNGAGANALDPFGQIPAVLERAVAFPFLDDGGGTRLAHATQFLGNCLGVGLIDVDCRQCELAGQ